MANTLISVINRDNSYAREDEHHHINDIHRCPYSVIGVPVQNVKKGIKGHDGINGLNDEKGEKGSDGD